MISHLKLIEMKNLLIFLFLLAFFGCSDHKKSDLESEEIHKFVNWLFSEENLQKDTLVFIQAEANTTWRSEYSNDVFTVDDLKESKNLSDKSLSSFLRPEDLDKIFSESNTDFRFDSDLLSNHIHLLNDEDVAKIKLEPLDFQTNGKIDFAGKYQGFEVLSKPVFFQDYRYCFVFIESVSWDLSSSGSGLGFYEKKNGKWEKIAVVPLNMAG